MGREYSGPNYRRFLLGLRLPPGKQLIHMQIQASCDTYVHCALEELETGISNLQWTLQKKICKNDWTYLIFSCRSSLLCYATVARQYLKNMQLQQVPGGRFAEMFGAKYIFGFSIFLSGVVTLLVPWAAAENPTKLICLRVLLGLFEVSDHQLESFFYFQYSKSNTICKAKCMKMLSFFSSPSLFVKNKGKFVDSLELQAYDQYYKLKFSMILYNNSTLQGATYPSMHAMLSKWTPPNERSRMSTLVYSGNTSSCHKNVL